MNTTPPTLAGLFFCLASDTVQGFSFARMQYSPTQAFTPRFAVSMQLYHPRHKTAHQTLQELFLRLHPLNRPRYQTDKSGYNTTCATPERSTGQHRPLIIIRYIRRCSISQTMPAAARQLLPCANRWQMLPPPVQNHHRKILRPITPGGWRSGTLHPAGQSSSKGAAGRRGTIGGYRRISFRAFAR